MDGIAAAVAVDDVVKIGSFDLFGRIFLGERQSALGQVETAAVGKYQRFVPVSTVGKIIFDDNALRTVSV